MQKINLNLKENQEKTLPLVWTSGSEEIVINALLSGRGANLKIVGAVALTDTDEFKITVNINHDAPDTTSDTLIKAVLTDQSQGKFSGLVSIQKGAKNTNTYFREDALLLSKKAKAEAIPSLEIDENEVKAGHASTVGPVDPEQVFYLMSRGLTQSKAKRMIVQGYFSGIINEFSKSDQGKLARFLETEFSVLL